MRLVVGLMVASGWLSLTQAFATEPGTAAAPPTAPAASTPASAPRPTTAGKKPELTTREKN